MVNIFTAFNKADDATIAMQVAQLQSITISNIMTPYAQKAGNLLISASNWLSKKFGSNTKFEPKSVTDIQKLIEQNYSKLKNKYRVELDNLLYKEFAKRVNHRKSRLELLDKIALSNEIINEAAKNFDIAENLTNAQKANAIALEWLNNHIREQLRKQNAEQTAKMEHTLEENIAQMSENEREQMKKALNVEELTGKTIRATLLKAELPALAISATGGFGVYIATTTILHAIFTTALGITLPFAAYTSATSAVSVLTGPVGWALVAGVAGYQIFSGNNKLKREILSQCICLAFIYNGRSFAPLENELAAWKSAKIATDNVYKNLHLRINQLEQTNASMISESELKATLSDLREEFDKQNELARQEIEREFENKTQEIESTAANKIASLERTIIERDELIERMEIDTEREFEKLKTSYEQRVQALNDATEKMRRENGDLIAKLEQNRSNERLRNKEIPAKLQEAIKTAQYEIDIMSPYYNADKFVANLRDALNRGVVVKIRYGIGYDDNRLSNSEDKIRDLETKLHSHNLKFKFGNEHSKLFICDEKFYVIGSFNTLSYSGDIWGEIGELSTNKNNLMAYREYFFKF